MRQPNVKQLSRQELEGWLQERREPAYRCAQIRRWLFQKRANSFEQMTNLSAALRLLLAQTFSASGLRIVRRELSRDGTEKFLFGLGDGQAIETVLIPQEGRVTLCLSTQVGCGFGCRFCATAQMGLGRNLQAWEIIEQVLEVQRSMNAGKRITNLVFMGMGEPLANYVELRRALKSLTDAESGLGFSPRRITVSTVGLLPQMRRLMEETRVNLAVSLHATSDNMRTRLMPVNRKYSLEALLACCRTLPLLQRKRMTFEYLLIRKLNDSPQDAGRLAVLLSGIRCKINLIPYNPHPGSAYQTSGPLEVERFQEQLQRRGFQVNVRRSRGQDVQAACGQLAGETDALLDRAANSL